MEPLELTTGLAIGLGIIAIAELFVIIRLMHNNERLWNRLNHLQTRVTDAEWREEAASAQANTRIKDLETLLQSQVQKALTPEAQELAAWIEETEQELTKDES